MKPTSLLKQSIKPLLLTNYYTISAIKAKSCQFIKISHVYTFGLVLVKQIFSLQKYEIHCYDIVTMPALSAVPM